MDDKPSGLRHRIQGAVALAGRYVGVGLMVTGTDYGVYLLAVFAGLTPVFANAISRVIATVVGAVLHRHYTFAGPQRLGVLRQILAYGALSGVNLGISTGLIILLHDQMGWPALWAKIGTDVVVMAISLVVGRLLIFAPAR